MACSGSAFLGGAARGAGGEAGPGNEGGKGVGAGAMAGCVEEGGLTSPGVVVCDEADSADIAKNPSAARNTIRRKLDMENSFGNAWLVRPLGSGKTSPRALYDWLDTRDSREFPRRA